jgi:[ribosomal protein S18]-alanine N-acetyltransferase
MSRPYLSAEVRIRPMTAADLDSVVAIAAASAQAPHWPKAAYLKALDPQAVPRRFALVAEHEPPGSVVGFAIASSLAPQAELESIAVSGSARRRGVATSLFAALVALLRLAAASEVTLEVRASNLPGLGFYRALGFVEFARRPRYYVDPIEDALLLRLPLS